MGAIANKMGVLLPGQDSSKRKGAPNNGGSALSQACDACDSSTSPENLGLQYAARGVPMQPLASVTALQGEDTKFKALFQLLGLLPESTVIHKLADTYFTDLEWLAYIIDQEAYRRRLQAIMEMRLLWNERPDALTAQEVSNALRFVALVFALSAVAMVFCDPDGMEHLEERYGCKAFSVFLEAAQHGLAAADIYEDPSIDNLRTSVLLAMAFSALKGPTVGGAIVVNDAYMASVLGLDTEPPGYMPAAERDDRIRLFATVCIGDWFSAGTVKRNFLIDPNMLEFPSLFGPDAEKNDVLPPLIRYRLKIADLSRRTTLRSNLSDDDAYQETLALYAELQELEANSPEFLREHKIDLDKDIPELSSGEEGTNVWYRLTHQLAVLHHTIALHKRFYILSWSNPTYLESRDICFSAAVKAVKTFRKTLSWFNPPEDSTIDEQQAMMDEGLKKRHSSLTRMWFFAQLTIISSLILVHYLSMQQEKRTDGRAATSSLSKEINEDLRFVRILLQALSSKSKVAKDGAKVLQPSEPAPTGRKRKADSMVESSGPPKGLPSGFFEPMFHKPIKKQQHSSNAVSPSARGSPTSASPSGSVYAGSTDPHRSRGPGQGMVDTTSVNSFDDLEALWSRQPWTAAGGRHPSQQSPSAHSPSMTGIRKPSASPLATMTARGGYANSTGLTGYSSSAQSSPSGSFVPPAVPGPSPAGVMAGSGGGEAARRDESGGMAWTDLFGPNSAFGDIASAEAAIGKQDNSFMYPVAPLSPFTSAFINSLDSYVMALDGTGAAPGAAPAGGRSQTTHQQA